jgi:hypothetical protein
MVVIFGCITFLVAQCEYFYVNTMQHFGVRDSATLPSPTHG